MKKLFFWFLTFLLFGSLVFAQQPPTASTLVNPSADFEKVVVKEHFVTKKEIKEHIDMKILEYQKTTEEELERSFDEVKKIIDSKINKFIFKLVVSIFAITFFSGSLWFFVRKRFERKYAEVQTLKPTVKKDKNKNWFGKEEEVVSEEPKIEPTKTINEREKVVSEPSIEPEFVEKAEKSVIYTFKDGEEPKYDKSGFEAKELQEEKERLLKEYEALKND